MLLSRILAHEVLLHLGQAVVVKISRILMQCLERVLMQLPDRLLSIVSWLIEGVHLHHMVLDLLGQLLHNPLLGFIKEVSISKPRPLLFQLVNGNISIPLQLILHPLKMKILELDWVLDTSH